MAVKRLKSDAIALWCGKIFLGHLLLSLLIAFIAVIPGVDFERAARIAKGFFDLSFVLYPVLLAVFVWLGVKEHREGRAPTGYFAKHPEEHIRTSLWVAVLCLVGATGAWLAKISDLALGLSVTSVFGAFAAMLTWIRTKEKS